ncbi:hypothetical protein ACPXCP_20385 [Streptomyces sp. DT20]|uniref:hypothetical protein n=1 Tax=Streptomyces sp. DT20 TaxID=3416519 RepID=UPI003CE7F135
MATFKISTPVPEFNGKVAGVWFANGEAETDSEGAVAYFERHGYGVEAVDTGDQDDSAEQAPIEPTPTPTPAEPKPKTPARTAKGG